MFFVVILCCLCVGVFKEWVGILCVFVLCECEQSASIFDRFAGQATSGDTVLIVLTGLQDKPFLETLSSLF